MKMVMFTRAATAGALLATVLTLVWGFIAPAAAAPAPTGTATVAGTVIDQRNALPIKDATVVVLSGATVVATGTTDAFGNFTISNVPAGVYDVSVRAKGYTPSSTLNVVISAGTTLMLNATLTESTSASSVRTIGTVAVSANALASATTITQPVNIQEIAQTGQIRFANQLATLPAINLATSSSPGDDVSINIRGFGSSETAALLDGRPVGPLGVQAPDSFNFSDTPISALDGVDVTYGSGAQGLYGSDTIAGAVNMHLLNPTTTPQYTFQQQVGGDGILSSAFNTTGSTGRLGYAVVAGVSGFSGQLNGHIFQSARPSLLQPGSVSPLFACGNSGGNDVSACNQAADTYAVTQDSKLTTELAKLKYSFTPNTAFAVSAYSTVQEADSTGNGDNDYLPYLTRLGQIEHSPPNCVIGGGTGTSNGYTVVTNPILSQTACYSAPQWAAVSYGPDGGGIGRNRSASMRDYDARFTSKLGNNNIAIDGYVNNYVYEKSSSTSGGLDANGAQLGTPDFSNYFNTHGLLLSDDFIGADNDFGFGYALLNQLQSGQQLVSIGSMPSGESIFSWAPDPKPALFREDSFFLRDTHEFSDRVSGFFNAWVKRSNVTGKTTFDPRVSGQFRPDANDVFRLTFGHSDGPPAPELKETGLLFEPDPGASLTNVSCIPGSNKLPATGGNPNLTSESANDVELGYGHRFEADSNIQVNAYVTPVSNELFSATEPLLQYGLNHVTFASTALQNYLTHLELAGCLPAGSTTADTYPFLGVPTTFNLANELARGVDINGRYRFMSKAYIDYGYSVESSQQFNIPATAANPILQHNPTLLNGAQQNLIPIHQGTISLDVQPGAFEVRLDNFYIGKNNPLDRPAYWYSNASISRPFDHNQYSLTLGGTNIFNQATQYYGLIGYGTPQSVNQFFAPAGKLTGLQQNFAGIFSNEEFGIQSPQLTLTLTARM